MIINEIEPLDLTPEQKEQMYWDTWKFDSHKWYQYSKGYYTCQYCGSRTTSSMPTNLVNLCEKNPLIVELLKQKL